MTTTAYREALSIAAAAAQAWIDGERHPDEITPDDVANALEVLNNDDVDPGGVDAVAQRVADYLTTPVPTAHRWLDVATTSVPDVLRALEGTNASVVESRPTPGAIGYTTLTLALEA